MGKTVRKERLVGGRGNRRTGKPSGKCKVCSREGIRRMANCRERKVWLMGKEIERWGNLLGIDRWSEGGDIEGWETCSERKAWLEGGEIEDGKTCSERKS